LRSFHHLHAVVFEADVDQLIDDVKAEVKIAGGGVAGSGRESERFLPAEPRSHLQRHPFPIAWRR